MKIIKSAFAYIAALASIIFLYDYNIGELQFVDVLPSAFCVIVITFVLQAMLKFLLQSKEKSSLCGGAIMLLLLSYNQVYVFANKFFLLRHRYLLPLCIIFLISMIAFVRKSKKAHIVVHDLLSIILFSFVMISCFDIGFFMIKAKFTTTNQSKTIRSIKYNKEIAKPDVYYIVLDSYPSNMILRDYYDFDNSLFAESLINKGFLFKDASKSNYAMTYFSLASVLNMKYVNYVKNQISGPKDMRELTRLIADNEVMKSFKASGYKIVHLGTAWGPTNTNRNADVNVSAYKFVNLFTLTLMRSSILNQQYERMWRKLSRRVTLSQFENLKKIPEIKEPTFTFAHIDCPHPPYVFGPNGEDYSLVNPIGQGRETAKNQFLAQIEYVNKRVDEVVSEILKKSEVDPIIILQADHGNYVWHFSDKYSKDGVDTIKGRLGVLMAFYAPKDLKSNLANNDTPINTFRVTLNYLFDTNYEELPENMYYSDYDDPYSFNEVTDVLSLQVGQ